MRTSLKIQIDKSEIGFRRFLKHQISYCKHTIYVSENFDSMVDLDEYAMAIRVVDLYDKFIGLLNEEEKLIVKYLQYHEKGAEKPTNTDKLFQEIYVKWTSVFFNKDAPKFKDINNKRIGKLMRMIRTQHCMSATLLARLLGVDRSTVSLYENGERTPNLNYVAKFCTLYSITIDELVFLTLDKDLTFK